MKNRKKRRQRRRSPPGTAHGRKAQKEKAGPRLQTGPAQETNKSEEMKAAESPEVKLDRFRGTATAIELVAHLIQLWIVWSHYAQATPTA